MLEILGDSDRELPFWPAAWRCLSGEPDAARRPSRSDLFISERENDLDFTLQSLGVSLGQAGRFSLVRQGEPLAKLLES
jgi:hypothetical protein